MENQSTLDWIHNPLSSLIASKLDDTITIGVKELAEFTSVEPLAIINYGEKIAEQCSQKFHDSPQPWYGWHVEYVPMMQQFIATKPNRNY